MITFEGAGKAFRGRKKGEINWILRNLNVTFPDKVNAGILAPRGQGKTTFINLACGNDWPSEGRIFRRGKVSFPWNSRANISNKLSGRQNLRFLTDVYGRDFNDVYDFVRDFSELGRYLDMPLKNYNTEMRSRLSVSAMFGLGFDYILVDDLMEGGDNSFRKRCVGYLHENKDSLTLLIATGNTQIVQKYCEVAGVLNEGVLTFYDSVEDAIRAFNKVNQVFL